MTGYGKKYEVLVVGAGHAGCEAALAAARMGCKVLLLTIGLDTIAQMSCNPSIGGLAKGHLVHEVDALGGEMGVNIDATGIQFRRLNMRKGPAVRAARAQADRMAYSARMKGVVERQDGLDLKQGLAEGLLVEGGRVQGVRTREGIDYYSDTVVLTTGTFMRGLIHIGMNNYPGGRAGEPAAAGMSESLRSLGLRLGRLKTGTPARLAAKSIDLCRLEKQFGDDKIKFFSFMTPKKAVDQVCCYVAQTNEKTHEIILQGLSRSPLYKGIIEGVGPRYCPSIEDKVVRFPEKSSHQSFLEPEGRQSNEMYPSGLSTSLPADVQLAYFRSMVGFEQVELMRPGYAIEYDFVEPSQLKSSLETLEIEGLYHAGQINGTSGYEEAAGQGLLAGINAARSCKNQEPVIIGRDQGYLGVMIDDLITQPTIDPYRMFTSRAEYRLLLREDNADLRLTPLGREIGLVTEERWKVFEKKQNQKKRAVEALEEKKLSMSEWKKRQELGLGNLQNSISFKELLKRPEVEADMLARIDEDMLSIEESVLEQVAIEIKYAGYIARQKEQVERFREIESIKLGQEIDYDEVPSLSTEVREKLNQIKPDNLGQASRIQGITPAAITVLQIYLRKKNVL